MFNFVNEKLQWKQDRYMMTLVSGLADKLIEKGILTQKEFEEIIYLAKEKSEEED